MDIRKIRKFLSLTRIDSSLLVFVVVFIPLLLNDHGMLRTLQYSLPLLVASMATFVLNDIYDAEKDEINHPQRPIPSNQLTKTVAMVFYFVLLFSVLVLVKFYIPKELVFLYLIFVILTVNYNHLVEYFPSLKNVYVALVTVIPIVILQNILNTTADRYLLSSSLFLFILGREILMDILDIEGDGNTLAKYLGPQMSISIAFVFQLIAIFLLCILVDSTMDMMMTILVAIVAIIAIYLWSKKNRRKAALSLMKLQLAACVVFLLPGKNG